MKDKIMGLFVIGVAIFVFTSFIYMSVKYPIHYPSTYEQAPPPFYSPCLYNGCGANTL
jgi:hypothetical protein